MKSPFKKAETEQARLKLLIWGESGAGKTYLSLQFPSVALLDLEKGSTLYGNQFDFNKIDASSIKEVEQGIEFLKTEEHEFKTLVIDPISVLYEMFQRKWSDLLFKYNKTSQGFKNEFYDMQPKDYMLLKEEWKGLIRNLLSLDMNIICIAREKPLYSDQGFMKKIGETFDCEKRLDYAFDTVIRLSARGENRIAQVMKDRGNKLGVKTIQSPSVESFALAFPSLSDKSEPKRTVQQIAIIKEGLSKIGKDNNWLVEYVKANHNIIINGGFTKKQADDVIGILAKLIKINEEVVVNG